jgi:hypothetical protein
VKLARAMERHELEAGGELETGDRYAVVVGGMLTGAGGVLRPGQRVSGRVRALTPAAVATCERAVYEEIASASR